MRVSPFTNERHIQCAFRRERPSLFDLLLDAPKSRAGNGRDDGLELRRNTCKIDRTHHQSSICCIERRRDARKIIGVDAGEVLFAPIATDAPMHRDASA